MTRAFTRTFSRTRNKSRWPSALVWLSLVALLAAVAMRGRPKCRRLPR
ncbi:MAG: hypothetical protein P3W96_000910 [Halomonas sp.]|nr:hypothetical protein [Halomonas sp.]